MSKRIERSGGNGRGVASVRCAVYTRKSTTEGLDSDFSSLDAQREACEHYIQAQASQGWVLVPTRYDDGGFTGGNVDRPGLQRLMQDIDSGAVDAVVVYKIDRLSRSLTDFTRLMERFEAHKVGFVSITQAFDTSTSMGRLTLNILLSFAQFEREMIAERTRDKVLAARARGKWTGGHVPLGYAIDKDKRGLKVVSAEAAVVRLVFDSYLKTRSLGKVVAQLAAAGLTQKKGAVWTENAVLAVLRNPTYVGKVRGRDGELHAGRHEAILSSKTFDAAGALLNRHAPRGERQSRREGYLLAGLLRCGACDAAMTTSYAHGRGGRAYRYYRCRRENNEARPCPTGLLPIDKVEAVVVEQLRSIARSGDVQRAVLASLEEQRKSASGADAKATPIRKRLAELSASAKNLVTACASGKASKLLVGRLAEVEAEMDRLRAQLAELDAAQHLLVDREESARRVVELLDAFDAVWDALIPAERHELMRLLVREAVVDPQQGHLRVTFHDLDAPVAPELRQAV